MTKPPTTAQRILSASRRLFNQKGYAATTLTQIAEDVGISQGNLTYHFSTKKDLAQRLVQELRETVQRRRDAATPGPIIEDYLEHLIYAMTLVWEHRFLFRDAAQLENIVTVSQNNPNIEADFEELLGLLQRLQREGMFRRDLPVDLPVLTRALWVVSRYWMDHVLEFEGIQNAGWPEQRRGLEHHFAVLLPYLTAPARKAFQTALKRLDRER